MIVTVILILLVVLMGAVVVLWRRNNAVYAFRGFLIDEIHRLNVEDINRVYKAKVAGDREIAYGPDWRHEEFDAVSYGSMVWRPWRSCQSFYREGFPATQPTQKEIV